MVCIAEEEVITEIYCVALFSSQSNPELCLYWCSIFALIGLFLLHDTENMDKGKLTRGSPSGRFNNNNIKKNKAKIKKEYVKEPNKQDILLRKHKEGEKTNSFDVVEWMRCRISH